MLNALKPIDMAILYDWYENPGTNEEAPEERSLHPRPLLNGKVTMRQLYNRVHARSSLTVGDVMNAIDCLAQFAAKNCATATRCTSKGWATSPPPWKPHRK